MENTRPAISAREFNLNLRDYSFPEILQLFDIEDYDFSMNDLRRAKKKVLMIHPDKSRLPPEYFLFYKKAFDIVSNYYKNNHKINSSSSTSTPTKYEPTSAEFDKTVQSKVNEMNTKEFNRTFNTLFEKNGGGRTDDANKNKWFKEEDPAMRISKTITPGGMGRAFDEIRHEIKQTQMVLHKPIQDLYSSFSGKDYYDEEDETQYVECDPFSKLKYDDLRKVHKDQTVFAVSETDFDNIPKYKNVNELKHSRNAGGTIQPLPKEQSHSILLQQEKHWKEQMAKRQYAAEMRTQENIEKSKNVLATFLRIS